MPKKIIITTLIVLITIMFPVNLKASLIPKEISQNYIIYEDDNFFIESTTTIYFLNSPLSNDRSVSKNKHLTHYPPHLLIMDVLLLVQKLIIQPQHQIMLGIFHQLQLVKRII